MNYENIKLCPDWKTQELCLVVEQYKEGVFERVYHLHIPQRRISQSSLSELLRSLVCRFDGFTGLGFETIVAAYLNDRKGGLSKRNPFQMTTSYPEPGVLRLYCGTNTITWADRVIVPSKFRLE